MPRSTREKSKTGTCHVGLGRNQKPVPVIFWEQGIANRFSPSASDRWFA